MSAICLTCEQNNLTENCVFTVQGDLECFDKGITPEQKMLDSLKQNQLNTNENVSEISGIDSAGYYRYISDLSGRTNSYALW
jgi:hypothetical protein